MNAILFAIGTLALVFFAYHVIIGFFKEVIRIGKTLAPNEPMMTNTSSFHPVKIDFRVAGKNANSCSACGRLFSEIDSCMFCKAEKRSTFGGIVHQYNSDCTCSECSERRRRLSC